MSKDTGTVNIHGKEYKTVALRLREFRDATEGWGIRTEIKAIDDAVVVVKATIVDENNFIVATGHAEENRSGSQINKTSALENCETGAVGRALAVLGYAGTEFASADEVANAIGQQKKGEATRARKPQGATKKQVDYLYTLIETAPLTSDEKKEKLAWFQAHNTKNNASAMIEKLTEMIDADDAKREAEKYNELDGALELSLSKDDELPF